MVRQRRVDDDHSYFDPDEAAVLKLAYDDAMAKFGASRTALGASEALATQILVLAALRAELGQSISGHSDAQLLSFLALQALK